MPATVMPVGWLIILAAFIASLGVVAASGLLLLAGQQLCRNLVPRLVSFAVGTLLAAAFLGLLPGALADARASPVLLTTLIGILVFFLLEKLLIWRHCHRAGCEVHATSGTLILVGDAFHNFVDGVVIAAAFLQSIPLGISTTLAVIAHEVPQEVGDFAILLDSGYSRARAFLYNSMSASTTLAGAGIAYVAVVQVQRIVPFILALSAASFIYIGAADLIPSLHRDTRPASGWEQFVLVLAGVALIAALKSIA
jgi:zinc and cadmium transporter